MGWDIHRFMANENIENALICTLCTEVVKTPVQTQCDHIYCGECIRRWLEGGNGTCPVDMQIVTFNSLKPLNGIAKQLLNKLIIRCKNYGDGCRLMSKLEDMAQLNEHELSHCTFAEQNLVRDIQGKHQEEANNLRKKISEFEDALTLKKGMHPIATGDNDKATDQNQKRITQLEKEIYQMEIKNTELCKTIEEKSIQLADVARNSISVSQCASRLADVTNEPGSIANKNARGKLNIRYLKIRPLSTQLNVSLTCFFSHYNLDPYPMDIFVRTWELIPGGYIFSCHKTSDTEVIGTHIDPKGQTGSKPIIIKRVGSMVSYDGGKPVTPILAMGSKHGSLVMKWENGTTWISLG